MMSRESHDGGRARRWAAVALLPALVIGCYTYRPATMAPQPGARLAFDVNDRGRMSIADSLGPGVTRIEGQLAERTDSGYVVHVAEVSTIRGPRARWSGETVRLRPEYLSGITERRFSKQRTALLAAGVAAALVAFIASRDLLGLGGGDDSDGNPPCCEESLRQRLRRTP
jgi:hypothetical protein